MVQQGKTWHSFLSGLKVWDVVETTGAPVGGESLKKLTELVRWSRTRDTAGFISLGSLFLTLHSDSHSNSGKTFQELQNHISLHPQALLFSPVLLIDVKLLELFLTCKSFKSLVNIYHEVLFCVMCCESLL